MNEDDAADLLARQRMALQIAANRVLFLKKLKAIVVTAERGKLEGMKLPSLTMSIARKHAEFITDVLEAEAGESMEDYRNLDAPDLDWSREAQKNWDAPGHLDAPARADID